MPGRLYLLLLLATMPAWAQVTPSATGGPATTEMMTPPPASGANYPTAVGAEERSNYLRAGLTFDTAYIDNLYAGSNGTSLSETTFSVFPTIEFDSSTGRQHRAVTYSPGFTFYRPSSELNEVDNTASVVYAFRPTPHTTVSASDHFQDSSTGSFGPADTGSGGVVSGSPEPATPGVTPPFAKRLTNSAHAEFSIQTGANVMIGASGLSTTLHFPNQAEATGLYDSRSSGGTAFYNHRLSMRRYFGATYQYLDMQTFPLNAVSSTQTHTIMAFYTFYVGPKLSLSVSGGPQRYSINQTPLPASSAWGPSVSTSMGWQGRHASLAANYMQSVTGGGGLFGAYHNKATSVSARWQMSRTWTTGISASYFVNNAVVALPGAGSQNGQTISGAASLDRSLGEQFHVRMSYDHTHENYSDIPAISSNPDNNSETVSITWQLARPLGR